MARRPYPRGVAKRDDLIALLAGGAEDEPVPVLAADLALLQVDDLPEHIAAQRCRRIDGSTLQFALDGTLTRETTRRSSPGWRYLNRGARGISPWASRSTWRSCVNQSPNGSE